MKILIAPGAFKDSMPADKAARYIQEGVEKATFVTETVLFPMADGGEGTVMTFVGKTGGTYRTTNVLDPLKRPIEAQYGVSGSGEICVIEMASASGIERLESADRNPWRTTSYGTGQLVKHALDHGCRTLLIGLGGSATVDLGTGALDALGIEFLDENGVKVPEGGAGLQAVVRIETGKLHPLVKDATIILACDVDNPLVGRRGAAVVFGPQKGANAEMVMELEKGLSHLADIIEKNTGKAIKTIPGGGAAGGMAAGLAAFLDANIKPGFETIADHTGLEDAMADCNLVITGEGTIDDQSLAGKTVFGVLKLARKNNIPVAAIAGQIKVNEKSLYNAGFHSVVQLKQPGMSLNESIRRTGELLTNAGHRIMKPFS